MDKCFQEREKHRNHQTDNLVRSFSKAVADKIMLITYVRVSSLDYLDGKFSVVVSSTLKIGYEFGPL